MAQSLLEHEVIDLVGEAETEAFADGNEQAGVEDRVRLEAFEAEEGLGVYVFLDKGDDAFVGELFDILNE